MSAPLLRDVAVELIQKRIGACSAELAAGLADDHADYRNRCGVIAGLEWAIFEIQASLTIVMGT